jgi:hypothetical protein
VSWAPGAALQETHQWEDPPGTDIQAYDAEAAARQLGITLEVDYYEMLEVSRDADAATIKRQYYILARKWHPGGCPALCNTGFSSATAMHYGHKYQGVSHLQTDCALKSNIPGCKPSANRLCAEHDAGRALTP